MVEHLFHVVRMRVVVPISWGSAKRHLYPRLTMMTRIMGPVSRVHVWLSRWIKAGCSYSEEAQYNVMLMKTKLNGRKPSPVDIFTQYGLDRSLYTSPNTNVSLREKCRIRGGVGASPGESVGQNICLGRGRIRSNHEHGKSFFILERCLWINDVVFSK